MEVDLNFRTCIQGLVKGVQSEREERKNTKWDTKERNQKKKIKTKIQNQNQAKKIKNKIEGNSSLLDWS